MSAGRTCTVRRPNHQVRIRDSLPSLSLSFKTVAIFTKNTDHNADPFPTSSLTLMDTGHIPDPFGQCRDGSESKVDTVQLLLIGSKNSSPLLQLCKCQ